MISLDMILSMLHATIIIWLGGGIFSALTIAPTFSLISGKEKMKLIEAFNSKAKIVYWSSIILLLASGILRAWFKGITNMEYIFGTSYAITFG